MSSRPRSIGIMGGTFDPIHLGHLVCAEEARFQFKLDEVVFVPAGIPWQKTQVSPAEDRYQMTLLATAGNEAFSVSRTEIDRPGPSYTADTLAVFRDLYGESAALYFISGADAILRILSWREPEKVLSQAHLIAARRPEFDLGELRDERLIRKVSVFDIPSLSISSTDIRKRVQAGRPIRYLVPDEVGKYIQKRGLYGPKG